MSVIEYIGSIGGVGGVLAFLIFLAYRYLVRQMRDDRMTSQDQIREDRKFMEDRLTKLIGAYNRTTTRNTRVLAELTTWLVAKNGGK